MATNYEVHCWHINPGNQGDAAIHLLTTDPVGASKKRVIERSVWLDGAEGKAPSLDMIKKTIVAIRNEYDCSQVPGQKYDATDMTTMRFDAIVISHWDQDHFGGVLKLLEVDLVNALAPTVAIHRATTATALITEIKNKLKKTTNQKNWSKKETTTVTLTKCLPASNNRILHIQSRYMKYATPVPAKAIPLLKSKISLTTQEQTDLEDSGYYLTKVYAWQDSHSLDSQLKSWAVRPPFDVTVSTFGFTIPIVVTYTVKQVCATYICSDYLGYELFEGEQKATGVQLKNPATLVKAALQPNTYGLFIVAGGRDIIGGLPPELPSLMPRILPNFAAATSTKPSTFSPSTVLPVNGLDTKALTTAPFSTQIKGNLTKPTHNSAAKFNQVINSWSSTVADDPSTPAEIKNAPSLCCMLIWRPAKDSTNPAENFRILHYTGGDAFFDVEGALAKWVVGGTLNWEVSCPLMKLSHHGASASTPVALLEALGPRCIIISTPKSAIHGHPRPETLFMIAAWYEFMKNQSGDKAERTVPPIYCLNSPYWFNGGLNQTLADIATNQKNEPSLKTYIDTIEDYWKASGTSPNVWEDWSNGMSQGWKATTSLWAANWDTVSIMDPNIRPAAIRAKFQNGDLPPFQKSNAKNQNPPIVYLDDYAIGSAIPALQRPTIVMMAGQAGGSGTPPAPTSSSPAQHTLRTFPDPPTEVKTTATDFTALPTTGSITKTGTDRTSSGTVGTRLPESRQATAGPPSGTIVAGLLGLRSTDTDASDIVSDRTSDGDDEDFGLVPINGSSMPVRLAMNDETSAGPGSVLPAIAPLTSQNGLAQTIPDSTPASVFRIFGSNFSISQQEQNAAIFPISSPLNTFVNALSTGFLTFDTKPVSKAVNTSLSVKDEWYQCLRANTLDIQEFSINGATDGQTTAVDNISAKIKVFSSLANPLVFQTQTRTKALSVSRSQSTKTSPLALSDAYVASYRLLVLGLDSDSIQFTDTTKQYITIGDLLQFFDLPWLSTAGSLPGLGNDLQFTIDTSADSRNGLYLQPILNYPTWLRMQLKLTPTSEAVIREALPFLPGFTNGGILIHCRRAVNTKRSNAEIVGSYQSSVTLEIPIPLDHFTMTAWITFSSTGIALVLTFPTDSDSQGSNVFDWLAKNLFPSDVSISPSGLLSGDFSFKVHQVSVSLTEKATGKGLELGDISVTIEIDIYGAKFRASLGWPSFIFTADVWNDIPPSASIMNMLMLPYYEEYSFMRPSGNVTGTASLMSIAKHVSGDNQLQVSIPSQNATDTLWSAHFEAFKDSNGDVNLTFRGNIMMAKTNNIPTVNLDLLELEAKYIGSKPPSYQILLTVDMKLNPRNPQKFKPADIAVKVAYVDSDWYFTISASYLQFAALYDLFDSDSQESVMDILEPISIPNLTISFDYIDAQAHFLTYGSLRIHTLELDFEYEYWSSPKKWQFQAQLGIVDAKDEIKIVDVIRDFDPDSEIANLLEDVPFVKDIAIPSVNSTPETFDDAPIQFAIGNTGDATVMWFRIEIDTPAGNISFLFVQHQSHTASAQTAKPKRILRIRVDKLPKIPAIPVVGNIVAPVDSIEYVLVLDSTGQSNVGKGATAGISMTEMTAINSILPPKSQIRYRDVQSSSATPNTNYVLLQGHHFVVVANNVVILDHLFGGQPAKQPNTPTPTPATGTNTAATTDAGSTKGPLSKTVGKTLSITNFGLQTKDDHLWILLDATIALGPIELTIIGFGVGIPLKVNGTPISFNNLKDVSLDSFDFRLNGLSVYFNQPPVLIAGFFEKRITAAAETYMGGLAVSILPYTILAVGAYTHTLNPDFKSVFLFGRLDGPILELEFAEIRGIELGFGYNYDLTLPGVDNINNFPLVHGASASNNPMDLMKVNSDGTSPVTAFPYWTKPSNGNNWFAIGMTVDACQILTIQAAAILVFGPNNFKIAIVGMASGALPPNEKGGKPPESILYVEFGVIAALDLFGGSFWGGLQLTPNSYVLAPDCHLTGGFAVGYWFPPSLNAGDFVFTVGGYAASYQRPAHYPKVDRLGIQWSIEDCLSVSGKAYLAVTPKETMAGGRLDMVFDKSPFYASFTAWADFMIVYKPLYLTADIGLAISVGFRGSLGAIHVDLHFDVSADIHLKGPPWSGRLHIKIIVSFDVNFGDQLSQPPPLRWIDSDPKKSFLALVQQPGPGSPAKAAMCVVALEEGSVNEKTKSADRNTGDLWYVRAGTFKFRLESKFPVGSMHYDDGHNVLANVAGSKNSIYAYPMQLSQPVTSELTFSITSDEEDIDPRSRAENPWIFTPLTRYVPKAIWQKQLTFSEIMAMASNQQLEMSKLYPGGFDDNTILHTMGYTFLTPNPKTPETPLTAFTFNAAIAMSEGVFEDGVGEKPGTPAAVDERPHLYPTPAVQTQNLPLTMMRDSALGSEWDTVATAWKSVVVGKSDVDILNTKAKSEDDKIEGSGVGQGFVDAWAGVMGWKQDDGTMGSGLVAKRPDALVEEFGTFYLECPWLTNAPVVVAV